MQKGELLFVGSFAAVVIVMLLVVAISQAAFVRCKGDKYAEAYNRSIGCYYLQDGTRVPTYLHPDLTQD